MKALRALAGRNVTFAGFLPRAQFLRMLGRARALVFAGCEDFGIVLAEAQGCGTPVVALNRGGARDIVAPLGESKDPTGVLFDGQSETGIREGVERFERHRAEIRPLACRKNTSALCGGFPRAHPGGG